MNRNDEFLKLRAELEDTPLKLDFTLERAKAKLDEKRRTSKKRAIFAPLGSFAAVFAVFVLLVNVSPAFAYAAGRIPLIKELAKAVAASPSLSAAVENEYVQPIELEQTENGITAKIEYAIVDQKQVNLFFTLHSDEYSGLEADPEIADIYSASYGCFSDGDDKLTKLALDFLDSDVPDKLSLTLKVYQRSTEAEGPAAPVEDRDESENAEHSDPNYIAELSFTVSLDPYFTSKGEHISLNEAAEIEGQKLTLISAEIYPTHMRFVFDDDESNTAWLKSLSFYVENEKGERFEGISNGITAIGDYGSPMMKTYMLESAFFAESKHLTMYITGAKWLDKDKERILVDLQNETAENLPDGVRLEQAVRKSSDWWLTFSAPSPDNQGGYLIFGWSYFGLDGTEYCLDGISIDHGGYIDGDTGEAVSLTDRFYQEIRLRGYTDSKVYLCPTFSRSSEFDSPVTVKIK